MKKLLNIFRRKIIPHSVKLFGFDTLSSNSIYKCSNLKSLGSKYGSWTIPLDFMNSNSICYCIGCGEDISFDLELIKTFNCDVYAYDPTPKAINYVERLVKDNPKYNFFKVGIWDKQDVLKFYEPKNSRHVSYSLLNLQKTNNYIEVDVKSLRQAMKDNQHSYIDLLKLDIEGAEYKVIDSIVNEKLNINVICVEYDEFFNPIDNEYISRIRSSINYLLSYGYSIIHTQCNGNYTLIKNSLLQLNPNKCNN